MVWSLKLKIDDAEHYQWYYLNLTMFHIPFYLDDVVINLFHSAIYTTLCPYWHNWWMNFWHNWWMNYFYFFYPFHIVWWILFLWWYICHMLIWWWYIIANLTFSVLHYLMILFLFHLLFILTLFSTTQHITMNFTFCYRNYEIKKKKKSCTELKLIFVFKKNLYIFFVRKNLCIEFVHFLCFVFCVHESCTELKLIFVFKKNLYIFFVRKNLCREFVHFLCFVFCVQESCAEMNLIFVFQKNLYIFFVQKNLCKKFVHFLCFVFSVQKMCAAWIITCTVYWFFLRHLRGKNNKLCSSVQLQVNSGQLFPIVQN